jgi:hypothetical protein
MKTSNILLSATRDCAKVRSANSNNTAQKRAFVWQPGTCYAVSVPAWAHAAAATAASAFVSRTFGALCTIRVTTRVLLHYLQVGDVGLARVLDNVTHHSNVMEWVRSDAVKLMLCCHVH